MSYLNINGLVAFDHLEFLCNDINVESFDIICIAETKNGHEDKIDISLTDFDIDHQMDNVQGNKSMGMVIYKRKSMEYFDILSINNPYYQCTPS